MPLSGTSDQLSKVSIGTPYARRTGPMCWTNFVGVLVAWVNFRLGQVGEYEAWAKTGKRTLTHYLPAQLPPL